MLISAALVALVVSAAPSPNDKPKLIVLKLANAGGVSPEVANAMTDAVTSEIAARGFFDVVSAAEVQTLVGVERQKQMLGCAEDSQSCLTELAGALGARFVVSGSLAVLGGTYQLSLQTLDGKKAQPIGRSTRIAPDLDTLRAQLAYIAAEATGTPLPPPPSKVVPLSLLAAGGLALVGGAVVGVQALSQEEALNRELKRAEQYPAVKPLSEYQDEKNSISQRETLSVVGLAAGAALVALGIVLYPADPLVSGGNRSVAMVPTYNGVAWVGVFP